MAKVNRQALQWAKTHPSEAIALGAKEHQISVQAAEKLFNWSHFYSDLSEEDIRALEKSQAFLLQQKMMTHSVDVRSLIFQK